MDEATAKARIARLTAAESYPELTPDDLTDLVAAAKRPDLDGLLPSDNGWTPSYDINRAVAMGWDIKAGRAAGDFRFEEDNQVFHREQVFDHCAAMVRRYSKGAVYVPSTPGI